MRKCVVNNLDETRMLAERFAKTLKAGDVVLLNGDLGAGKTSFTQFVFKCMGVEQVVNSPTFAVLKSYTAKGVVLNHIDADRITTAEAIECGFDEVLSSSDSITFIEWSQNISELLPKNCIKIDINIVDGKREFVFYD